MAERAWLGRVSPTRWERHYGDRLVRCFVKRPASAYALLGEAAERNPDGEALICGDERLSYRDFERAVKRCAAGLQDLGIRSGDRVALLLGNGIVFPVVMFAALRIGAIAVPLSVREQTNGLAYMLAHSGAKLSVHDAELAERLPEARQTPDLVHRVAIAAEASWTRLPLLAEPSDAPPADVQEEDTAIILYTSGTTGLPKGAMLDASRHLPFGDALRILHGIDGKRPRRRRGADESRHRRDRAHRRHDSCRGGADRDAGVQGWQRS